MLGVRCAAGTPFDFTISKTGFYAPTAELNVCIFQSNLRSIFDANLNLPNDPINQIRY